MLEDKQREFTDQLWNKLQTEKESWLCFDLTRVSWDTFQRYFKNRFMIEDLKETVRARSWSATRYIYIRYISIPGE